MRVCVEQPKAFLSTHQRHVNLHFVLFLFVELRIIRHHVVDMKSGKSTQRILLLSAVLILVQLLASVHVTAAEDAPQQGTHTSRRPSISPRLLHSFSLELEGGQDAVFSLFDSDPRPQAASFCAQHHQDLTAAANCAVLTAEAEIQFFSHQWLLQSSQYVFTQPSGETAEWRFDLYSGPVGPVLQTHRFCAAHSLPLLASDCLSIAAAAQDMYYRHGRLLHEMPLHLSSAAAAVLDVSFKVFDNLVPSEQAHDLCRLHGIELSACEEIVALAESVFYPSLTAVILPAGAGVGAGEEAVQLELFERVDPALTALAACSHHTLPTSRCTQLLEMAETAYFTTLHGDKHNLRQTYSFPGASFPHECHLYEGLDPDLQALRCCDRNGVSKTTCGPVLRAVRDLFFHQGQGQGQGQRQGRVVASFSLQLTEGDPPALLELYSTLDPFTQLASFCRRHAIMLADCLGYLDAAETTYYEATGALVAPIAVGSPVDSTFLLYHGRDPVEQTERFCSRHHMLPVQCESLVAHAFQQYVAKGNELTRISLLGVDGPLVLVDNMDPRHQVDYFCKKHALPRASCAEVRTFAEHQYFGVGDLITAIPMTIRNVSLVLHLYQNIDPLRQAQMFCDQHRIAGEECVSLRDFAKTTFEQAGRVIDVIRMFLPSDTPTESPEDEPGLTEKQMTCYDNLDPFIQAQHWCAMYAMSASACTALVDIFETTFFRAGDVISEIEFGDLPFTLRNDVDPIVQASRFCRRNQMSLTDCHALVDYCESTYYKYGIALSVYDVQSAGSDEMLSFTLHDRADPAAQVDRFCQRHKIPDCEELKNVAEESFFEAGTVLGTLVVAADTSSNSSFVVTLYSNLDPAVQAQRWCAEHKLTREGCDALIDSAEKVYFHAGEELSFFSYSYEGEGGERNVSFTLYNHLDPQLQLDRFFRRHPRVVPALDRPRVTAAMTEQFYAAGELLSSINVTIQGVADPVSLDIYDNLDPMLQTKNFCSAQSLSLAACEDLIAAAEEDYFGAAIITHFSFSLGENAYRFNYLDRDMGEQVARFCRLHEATVSARSCEAATALLVEQQVEAAMRGDSRTQQAQEQEQEEPAAELQYTEEEEEIEL